MTDLELEKKLTKSLKKGGFDYPNLWAENGVVFIEITWGDWKHDHGFVNYLMEQEGYTLYREDVTEDNESDCYSSIHIYIHNK